MTDRNSGGGPFIASNRRTVHRGDRESGPECGTRQKGEWAMVDAETAEEAVMDYNLTPCTDCIQQSLRLERWRKDVHSPNVIHNANTPEKWLRKFDPFYDGDGADGEGSA